LIHRARIRAGGTLAALLALAAFAPAARANSLEEISVGANGTGNAKQWAQ
jgi:hypothetical protein